MSDTASVPVVQSTVTLPAVGEWTFDPAHSAIEAVARHMMVTKVRGRFNQFTGTIHMAEKPEDSWVEVTIDAASIDTRELRRDDHMRSPDFLDVETYPSITFRSTGLEPTGGNTFRLTGDLTIRGVTRPVVLECEFFGVSKDPWGNDRALFTARTELTRDEFGMTWNQALEAGGVLVSRKLQVELEVQALKASPQQ